MTGRPENEEGGGLGERPGVAGHRGDGRQQHRGAFMRLPLQPGPRGGEGRARTRVLLVLSRKPSGSGSKGVAFPEQLRPPFPLQKSSSPREGPQACPPWEICSQKCSHQMNTGRPLVLIAVRTAPRAWDCWDKEFPSPCGCGELSLWAPPGSLRKTGSPTQSKGLATGWWDLDGLG